MLLLPGSLGVLDNNLYDGLVAFWNFEEADGGPYNDVFAADRTTDLDWVESGTVTKGTGRPGEGVVLAGEGVNSDLQLAYAKLSAAGNTDVLLTTQDWTMAFWLYLDAFTTGRLFTTNDLQPEPGINLRILTGPALNLRMEDGVAFPQGSFAQALTLDAWNHITIRHEHGVQTEFVLNGTPASDFRDASSVTGTLDNGNRAWKIGRATQSFGGTVDSLGFWNRLITNGNIAALYNAGRGVQYPFGDPTANVF